MTATTTKQLTLAYGDDERMVYVMDGDEQFAVMSAVDAVEAATEQGAEEPDYEYLADLMTEMLADAIAASGYDYTARELRLAVAKYVTPAGGPYEAPTFAVTPLPSTQRNSDKVEILTGSDPTLVTVSVDETPAEGSRKDEVPTILLQGGPDGINWSVRMTWDEARALAEALSTVTDVAENG